MGNRLGLVAAVGVLAASIGAAQGTITTVVGSSTCCSAVDGVQALNYWLTGSTGLTMDSQGNFYIWEASAAKIKKVSPAGIITTVAGNGTAGYSGDGGPATAAEIFPTGSLSGLAVDSKGNLFISDSYNNVVRKVDTTGRITTVAGNGTGSFFGDGGPATSAQLFYPSGIAIDSAGNLYIADNSNNRVRKVDTTGRITTVAGNGNVVYSGDNVPATSTTVHNPAGLAFDSQGNLYISEGSDDRVRKVDPSGNITTVAGLTKKTSGFSGDGGPATSATLSGPLGLAVDSLGNLYIADNSNGRIRKVNAAGIISTYAGITGTASSPIGDGGPSTSAYLGAPKDVVLDSSGNLYILGSAAGVNRVRKVTPGSGAGFVAAPTSLSFTDSTGGTAPAAQSVSVTSTGAALSFTAAASTSSGSNWLSVSPTTGSTPATLTVSVNTAGLGAGTYQGQVSLTPGGSGNSPLVYNVTLTVTGAGTPTVNSGGIVNALSYQNKLAPDTVFVVFGTNMGPASLVAGSPNYGTNLGGTSITFTPTAGGTPVSARIVYTIAGQVAGLLPSSITPGTYGVTVSYGGLTSAPQSVTVVAREFGIATSNSAGNGTAQATIANVNGGLSLTRFTSGSNTSGGYTWTLTPAHPGDTLVLWGTGGGADPANDAGGTSGDQTAAGNFQVIVDGRQITPLYAGASPGYPGLWQINFTLPADITPDCFAQAQVSAGGNLSNVVNVPIAAAGQAACSDPSTPAAALAQLDAGDNVNFGAFAIAELTSTVTQETASGSVFSFTPAEWITLNSGPLFGACRVYDRTYAVGGVDPGSPSASLDAGASLPLTGPNLPAGFAMARVTSSYGPIYSNSPASGTWTGGTYNLSGTGGTQVGAFNTSVVFPTAFTVSNWDGIGTINRNNDLQLTWSGSNFSNVAIVLSTTVVSSGMQHLTTINCTVPGAPGGYTVPAAALAYLSPASGSASAYGTFSVQGTNESTFTANLVGGGQLDLGGFSANLGAAKSVIVQ